MLLKRKWQDHSRCPLCNSSNEKSSHVLLCPNRPAKENFKTKIETNLKPTLESTMTAPSLQKTLLSILTKWRNGTTITPESFPRIFGIREAVKDQSLGLGWTNFVLGRWSPKWQTVQQQYYNRTRSKRTSKRWATSIIHKLLLTVWDLWDYRNSIKHGGAGPIVRSQHRQLNTRIRQEFREGYGEILAHEKYLFRSYTFSLLARYDLAQKKQWLESVQLARKIINNNNAPISFLAAMRKFIQDWLN